MKTWKTKVSNAVQRPTGKNMGINSHSTIAIQGDQTNKKFTLLPVLENPPSITHERHSLCHEQLSPSNSTTMNWDMESNYICPTVNNNYVHLTECVNTAIQTPSTTKSNHDEQIQQDGTGHNTPQPSMNNIGTSKQNFSNFATTDLNGSKVIRLVRAKQATKRKSSLDTLIEVVQKELLRVNGQTNSTSPPSSPPHYSQTRSTTSAKQSQVQTRSTVFPSSQATSQSGKSTRKRGNQPLNNAKRIPSTRNRNKSFNQEEFSDDLELIDDEDLPGHEDDEPLDPVQSSSTPENIDEIVRDTVDRLVAITLLNNAPFIVNMITGTSGTGANTSNETKPLTNPTTTKSLPTPSTDYYRNDLALLSSAASELRNSMQQNSPTKQQIILPTEPNKPSTVFVTPRILNFQTVVPKPTTNIQIGNTKIILVSPTGTPSSAPPHPQQQTLVNNNPMKLVKLTSPLPKNVQIVIPSRTSNESLSAIRPLSTVTTCSIDQIPQAAQEVTITTSPNLNKPRRRSSSTTTTDKPVGKILRPIAKVLPVYSPNDTNHVAHPSSTHEELIKPMTVNFQQKPISNHGPMIYRMTSVNPNVPFFRVRAATTPTMKTDPKPISVAAPTSMSYDPKQTPNATTTGGSVSVLACFKTTQKRIKERAIMPRPSATDSLDFQQRMNSNSNNVPVMINNPTTIDEITNSNSSASSRLAFPTKFPEKKSSNSRPAMEDKSIQCIDEQQNSTEEHIAKSQSSRKRNSQSSDESWTVAADTLLRNVLSQYGFRFLDVNCQQNLSAKFDIIQANLVSGMISSKNEFYQSVVDIKDHLLANGLSKISADNLEKLFHYFELEYPKISDGDSSNRKRTRRQ